MLLHRYPSACKALIPDSRVAAGSDPAATHELRSETIGDETSGANCREDNSKEGLELVCFVEWIDTGDVLIWPHGHNSTVSRDRALVENVVVFQHSEGFLHVRQLETTRLGFESRWDVGHIKVRVLLLMDQLQVEKLCWQCFGGPLRPALQGFRFTRCCSVCKHVNPPATVCRMLVADVDWDEVTDPSGHGGFEATTHRESEC